MAARAVEAVFGNQGPYPPLAVPTDAGAIQMRGRIDRIDQGEEGYRVLDYKTGSLPTAGQVKEGISLQLVAYALALEQVIAPGAACVEGVLLQVGTSARVAVQQSGRSTSWEEARRGFFEGVAAALRGIREAAFPPTPQPDVCARCDARRMCRIDASRIRRKREVRHEMDGRPDGRHSEALARTVASRRRQLRQPPCWSARPVILVRECQVSLERSCPFTFTEKAAAEMKDRLRSECRGQVNTAVRRKRWSAGAGWRARSNRPA